ncbi:MAG: protein-tyrosine kinase [Lachnospiraceae bacterium]|nr:protein-tyrosine kinase [Lachnospiraceae bacterium]
MRNREDEIEIDLAEVLLYLIHWLWLIVLAGIISGGVGLILSACVIAPKYESTTKVYILNKQNNNGSISYSDTQLATQLTKDYEELITCRNVLEKVIDKLDLDVSYEGLLKRVTVANATDTRIISITVKDEDPEEARRMANEIRNVASQHIKSVMDIEAVNVVDEANLPDADKPAEPSVIKYTAIGAVAGLFLCICVLMIKCLSDDTIRVSEDVERYLELSTIGLIPYMDGEGGKRRKNRKKHLAELKSRYHGGRERGERRIIGGFYADDIEEPEEEEIPVKAAVPEDPVIEDPGHSAAAEEAIRTIAMIQRLENIAAGQGRK